MTVFLMVDIYLVAQNTKAQSPRDMVRTTVQLTHEPPERQSDKELIGIDDLAKTVEQRRA